ncbi:MAG: DegT/DnrJ/EryC1/StrS family aminotransferase [Bacteroidetes bacterium]|nr:DegT/DnrJ/EryC1/StrS family aminotransferase [Bacteroidota bacterium]MCL1968916.1 DegT/DnrJ/EryC1/StrS family aminotransferase [Bacteroidota bacterium]
MSNIETTYKKDIAACLDTDANRIFLYWKGRVALYALLKTMGVGKDDEVILPAFTCVVVANAIIYLGAKPIYVDIDLQTYNARFENIKKAVTPKTKVIICQNTFGLSSDIDKITTFAKEQNIFTIEDCTHGFGGYYNQKPNGTYCDAAFYSTQWNKPFSTGTGGVALVNNDNLPEILQIVNQELINPSLKQKISLKFLYFVREKLLNEHTYWLLVKLYRFLSRHNLVLGSSSGEEINSIEMPPNYFMKLSDIQIKKGIKNLRSLPETLVARKENAHIYTEYLMNRNKNYVPFSLFENHSFLKYPLLVKNKEEVFRVAEKHQIALGEWFCSPIHPVQKDFELWKLDTVLYPNADYASKHIVNLPTEIKDMNKVLNFLDKIEQNVL